jgi:hypothetical protein
MLLTDLLDRFVVDADGAYLGHVIDARFVLDGAPVGVLAAPRLHGLLVSPRTATSFLGYERSGVTAPWPVGSFLRWRHRGTFLVHWADVDDLDAVEEGTVRLRAGAVLREPGLPRR